MLPSRSPYAPIPGTERPRRAIFLDRWGTLFEQPERGFCASFEDARLVRGASEALFRAQRHGWTIYLIGNEEAVAFGHLSEPDWRALEKQMLAFLDGQGIAVRRNYACIDHPEGKGKRQGHSVFQLPNTGVFYHAVQYDSIRLTDSWVIGDSSLELAAGDRAGCRLAAVRTGRGLQDAELHVEPHLWARDVVDALGQLTAGDPYRRP